ncbi:cytochrome P460 family protein [Coralliovum pocilloporae]|uniref:cytochrome P460 family protein n=1 Tax=Coralliovum pocilloporae TaxID=3066369 RepID=UPI003306FEAA
MRLRSLTLSAVAGLVLALSAGSLTYQSATAADSYDWKPKWTEDGQLILPKNFHKWVFLGSPLTPHALNGGKAGFPEYHNVYVQPEAFDIYRKTGEFPEGTIMLKELQLTQKAEHEDGSRNEVSGRGFFPGALNGIDISVKDSKRFAKTNNWGFFNFGHHAPPYAKTAAAAPAEACAQCHIDNATKDMVFTKFYSILDSKSHQ